MSTTNDLLTPLPRPAPQTSQDDERGKILGVLLRWRACAAVGDVVILDILRALRDVLIFFAFVAVLVTAPTWGEWLDNLGKTSADAERQWKAYKEIRRAP